MFSNLLLLPQSLLLSLLLHDVTPVLGDLSAYSNDQKQPDTDPVIALNYDTIFVSWDGATDVDRWMLELGVATTALGHEDILWEIVSKTKKAGFETAIKVPKETRTFLRVVAYNGAGKALGATEAIRLERQQTEAAEAADSTEPKTNPTSTYNFAGAPKSALHFLAFCVSLMTFGIVFAWFVEEWRRPRKQRGYTMLSKEEV